MLKSLGRHHLNSCGSGTFSQLSWVFLVQGQSTGAVVSPEGSTRDGSASKLIDMVVGRIYFLAGGLFD